LRPISRTALPPALALALAACNGGGGDEEQARSGEVLEGTISDAMLPLDTVRSQPPLAEPEAGEATEAATGTRRGGTSGPGARSDSAATAERGEQEAGDSETAAAETADESAQSED
jgi:hypothetical protein